MTYERLIIAVDEVAPDLEGIAYKLLWRLIAFAIKAGRPDVAISIRDLANGLKVSKEATAAAMRELGKYIRIVSPPGQATTFYLPADWFPPQRTLFSDETLGGDFHNRPNDQDTSVLFTRTPVSHSPGHQCPTDQDTCPNNQDTGVPLTRTVVPLTRTLRPGYQDTEGSWPIRNAHARNRSIESESSVLSEVGVIIDRAWETVQIPEEKEADAALLSEAMYCYKRDLGPLRDQSGYPDTAIVARILALAPYPQIHLVLRSLREKGKTCGDQDAWFFTCVAQKIHRASPELVRSRMAAGKAKARTYESKPSLFGDELVKAAAAHVRKLA